MSVCRHEFPNRAQEFLQYMSIIRHAAQCHRGLGWCIYDFRFRWKAELNISLNWSEIDQQLWLIIFTIPSAVHREEYRLFPMDSKSTLPSGPSEGTFATTSIGLASVNETRVDSAIFVTGAMAHRQEISVQSLKGREQTKSIYPTANAISTDLSADVLTYLTPTPIVVTKLEDTLAGHQHTWFVSQLCDNLRYGPELDWRESERLDFQKNCLLPLPIQALSLQIWKTRSPLATWLVHSIPHRFLIFKSPQLV